MNSSIKLYVGQKQTKFCRIGGYYPLSFFAKITGATLYIVHLSTKEGPELIEKLRGEGINIVLNLSAISGYEL